MRGRPRLVALFLGLLLLISFGLSRLIVGPQQEHARAAFHVVFRHYGVGAESMETTIAIPLEVRLRDLTGLERLSTVCEDSTVTANLQFTRSTDRDRAFWGLRDRVDRFYQTLPRSVQKPEITGGGSDEPPVLIVAFSSSSATLDQVRELVDKQVKPLVQRIPGAGDVEVGGGRNREVHVEPNEARLAALGLTDQDLATSLNAALVQMSPGTVHDGSTQTGVFFRSYAENPSEMASLRLGLPRGGSAALSSLAAVRWGYREPDTLSRSDGVEKISLYVRDNGEGNTVQLCRQTLELLPRVVPQLTWKVVANYQDDFDKSLKGLVYALFGGLILAAMVLVLFRPLARPVGLFVLGLLVSASAVLALLPLLSWTLSPEVLAALAASFGLAVDPFIIVLQGSSNQKSLGPALRSAVLTTALALVPLMMQGEVDPQLPLLAFVLLAALLVSAALSLTFVPRLQAVERVEPTALGRVLVVAAQRLFDLIIKAVLRSPRLGWSAALAVTLGSIFSFVFLQPAFTPEAPTGTLSFRVDFENKTSVLAVDARLQKFLSGVQALPKVRRVDSFVRLGGAVITVAYRPGAKEVPLEAAIRGMADSLHDASISFPRSSSPGTHRLEIDVTGPDPQILRSLCRQAAQVLVAQGLGTDPVLHFKDFPPQIIYRPSPRQLSTAHASVQDWLSTFRQRQFGPVVTKVVWGAQEYDVRLGRPGRGKTIDESEHGVLASAGGLALDVAQLGSFSWGTERDRITRLDGVRAESFSINLKSQQLAAASRLVNQSLDSVSRPAGYSFRLSTQLADTQRLFLRLFGALGLCVIFIAAGLAFRFNSWSAPLLILSVVPTSFFLPVIVILATGTVFSLSVLVALIAASGLVTNNAILLVEAWFEAQFKEFSRVEALRIAIRSRLVPLLTSSFAAALAILPLLFLSQTGDVLARSLALVIATGVPSSLVGALVVFPLFALGGFSNASSLAASSKS